LITSSHRDHPRSSPSRRLRLQGIATAKSQVVVSCGDFVVLALSHMPARSSRATPEDKMRTSSLSSDLPPARAA
jgi:hypothetical protein